MLLATLLLFRGGRALIDRSVQLRVGERGLSWKTGVFGRSPRLMEWSDILSARIERGYRVRNLVVELSDGSGRHTETFVLSFLEAKDVALITRVSGRG